MTQSKNNQPYIIAEIGSNHNGDMQIAEKLIASAKESGADCVKFQSWSKETIFSKIKYEENYFLADDYRNRTDYTLEEIVEEFSVSEQELIELQAIAHKNDIEFSCTPFSNREAEFLAHELNVPFIKVASMDVNNYPFLNHVAKLQKPIVLSTGLSTLSEIDKAILTIEATGNKNITILHCVAEYPPKDKNVNLNNIVTLQNCFPDYDVGFSDHSIGTCLPLASVALGVKIIEKHFTLDKNMFGWDHKISATPAEMSEISEGSKRISDALGSYRISALESDERKSEFRRSIVTTKAIGKGHIFTVDDLTFKRPGTGIKPEFCEMIIGRSAQRDIEQDELLTPDDF